MRPNCGALTIGALGTYLSHLHWFEKVYMKCPNCGQEGWLKAIAKMRGFLEGIDSSIVEKIHDRMMKQLVAFLVHGQPLGERPRLGS